MSVKDRWERNQGAIGIRRFFLGGGACVWLSSRSSSPPGLEILDQEYGRSFVVAVSLTDGISQMMRRISG